MLTGKLLFVLIDEHFEVLCLILCLRVNTWEEHAYHMMQCSVCNMSGVVPVLACLPSALSYCIILLYDIAFALTCFQSIVSEQIHKSTIVALAEMPE